MTTTTSDATHIIVAPGLRPPASCHGKNLVTMEVRVFFFLLVLKRLLNVASKYLVVPRKLGFGMVCE